jgi:prepilin-type N-terminal cleavage/methylation domain-containing protein
MAEFTPAEAREAHGCAWLRAGRAAAAQDGLTLTELLVVLAILGTVLAGLTVLLTSALRTQTDQTNRIQAQQDARLGLDKLRREIHCASTVTAPSGYPSSAVTITLGSYCPTTGGAATTVTWCTQDKNGTAPPVTGAQPYTLWRYVGSTCSGTGTQWASNLVDKADSPIVTAGKIFNAALVPAASLTSATTGGTLPAGTYWYDVTAVLGDGTEVPGAAVPLTVANTSLTNQITINWSGYAGAVSYNVYGWDDNGLRLLKNITSGTSYVDIGPTALATDITLPSPTIGVVSTLSFNAGANTIAFGASGAVSCTGITSNTLTGCGGGQAGQYDQGMPVRAASSARPPRATLSVTLPIDKTPADASQRFVLADNIVLRNSHP